MITNVDFAILDWIQRVLGCGFMDTVMPVITKFCDDGIFFIALTVVLLIFPKTRKLGLAAALALIINHVATNMVIKNIVCRPRPCHLREVELLVSMPSSYSFPSGHTSTSFAVTAALMIMDREKWLRWLPVGILSCLIAFSRLYLYVHFPTDVLGGILVGACSGVCGALLAKRCPTIRKSGNNRETL